jgi:hypothetical protein
VIDRGGGGSSPFIGSFFKLALPAKFEYENPGDDFQRGLAGEAFSLRATVTDLVGAPVKNARVHWAAISSPGNDADVTSPTAVLTNAQGIAEATVLLSASEGNNVFDAFGRGIADGRNAGCSVQIPTPNQNAPCNGPRDATFTYGPFDPFMPFHSDLFDAGEVMLQDEAAVEIAEGTRLRFTVFGCIPGRGSASVNGTLADGEWDCANSQPFPVNLSGGSTVMATFYWMNDDQNMYLAVAVPGTGRENALRIEWDRNGVPNAQEGDSYAGTRDAGADVWEFVPGSGPADKFIDEKCSTSTQSSCGLSDEGLDGVSPPDTDNQTVAAFNNTTGGVTVYELSHPLNTGEVCAVAGRNACGSYAGPIDLTASAGSKQGMFITLRLGSGAQGNTQWPGFRRYLIVQVK